MQSDDGEEPGILGSALSLPHTDLSDTPEEHHHHDDIVEHLDAIGRPWLLYYAKNDITPQARLQILK